MLEIDSSSLAKERLFAMIRQHVYYSGAVQGVGFRYTAANCARKYDVVGYVRNLEDGRVELVAEGSEEEVQNLLSDVHESMAGRIRSQQVTQGEYTGTFSDFSIRH